MKKPKHLSTPLSECLLFDPTSPGGAIHDLDPFGSYLTGEAGTIVLFRVFLAVAKNTKRFLVTSYEGGNSLLQHRVDGKLFSGGALDLNGIKSHTHVNALPDNSEPEEVGRLCYFDGSGTQSSCHPKQWGAKKATRRARRRVSKVVIREGLQG